MSFKFIGQHALTGQYLVANNALRFFLTILQDKLKTEIQISVAVLARVFLGLSSSIEDVHLAGNINLLFTSIL